MLTRTGGKRRKNVTSNLNVPINSLGYGVVGYNVWKHLSQSIDVTLFPIGHVVAPPTDDGNKNIPVEISKAIHNDSIKANNFDGSLTTLKIWHENQLAERVGSGKYYAWPFFEISEFDQRRITHMQSVDQIIVSSEWAKNIVERNILIKNMKQKKLMIIKKIIMYQI